MILQSIGMGFGLEQCFLVLHSHYNTISWHCIVYVITWHHLSSLRSYLLLQLPLIGGLIWWSISGSESQSFLRGRLLASLIWYVDKLPFLILLLFSFIFMFRFCFLSNRIWAVAPCSTFYDIDRLVFSITGYIMVEISLTDGEHFWIADSIGILLADKILEDIDTSEEITSHHTS